MKVSLISAAITLILIFGCNPSGTRPDEKFVFRYNESKGITTLDPAFAKSLPVIWPVHQLYNGLVQLNDTLGVEPCIAKHWTLSENGKLLTFFLRPDVSFHPSDVFAKGEGRRVTASDFVYSFNRIINPTTASPGSWIFSFIDQDFFGTVNGLRAVNDTTLEIHLKSPFPAFLGLLTMPYCYVVPFEAIEKYGKDFRSNPVGTGPFYLKYWKEGERLIMRKNPHYFERDQQGKPLPYIEAVSISFIADKQSEFLEFIKGKIDFISGVHPSSKDELLTRTGELNPAYSRRAKLISGQYLNTEYLGILLDTNYLGPDKRHLLNVKVRQAIGHGFDRRKMMLYLRSNMGYPAEKGFVPTAMPGFETRSYGFSYNPELSRKLLAEAGYPNGKGLPSITISTTDDYVDICEYIQHQLNVIGFDVNVEVFPGSAYREMMANSKLSIFRGSWVADYADPENYLSLFYSPNFSPGGPNYTHFKNDEYDKLYTQALLQAEYSARLGSYKRMDSIAIANAVVIPLYYDKVVRFVSCNIEGLGSNPMNLLVLKKVWKE